MSTYKIYKIIDANKASISYRLPNSKKNVEFKSLTFGSKFADGKLTYGTNDAEIQTGVESLSDYKKKVITIEREVVQEDIVEEEVDGGNKVEKETTKTVVEPVVVTAPVVEPVVVTAPVVDNGDNTGNTGGDNGDGGDNTGDAGGDTGGGTETIEGPTTIQEAKDWLKANKNIDGRQLQSVEKVKVAAEQAGVVFPNVVWP